MRKREVLNGPPFPKFGLTQNHSDTLVTIVLKLLQPNVFEILKRGSVGRIVYKEGTESIAVVDLGHRLETLLPSRVPNLCLDHAALKRNLACCKFQSHCRRAVNAKVLVGKATAQLRLTR